MCSSDLETTDTVAATGGDDVILLGDGNNVVLGGMGADTITTGVGVDTIFGDNGYVQMDAVGGNLAAFGTKSQPSTTGTVKITDLGGNDVIVTQSGDKWLVGGDGADQISATVGNHTVVGDNAEFSYVALGSTGAGKVLRYETTDTVAATGGNDVIVLGDGNNVVLGGMGADQITTGVGIDTIFGDNGYVQMDVQGGNLAAFGTKSQPSTTGTVKIDGLGGDDVILTGSGQKWLLGDRKNTRLTPVT